MNCPHCKSSEGHHSTVTYLPVEGEPGNVFPRQPRKSVTEAYWFCHHCATLIYEVDEGYSNGV